MTKNIKDLRLEKGKIENAYETRLTIAFKSPSTELILQLDYQLTMQWVKTLFEKIFSFVFVPTVFE